MSAAALLLLSFALPGAIVWRLCRDELFGDAKAFKPEDSAVAYLTTGLYLTLLACPFAVGWLSCIIWRTGAESWPFVGLAWAGVFAGGLAARSADCRRVWRVKEVYETANRSLSEKARALGIMDFYDSEPHGIFGGYRPELHALWWLRQNDQVLPKVEAHAEADGSQVLWADGVPMASVTGGKLSVIGREVLFPLRELAVLLAFYDAEVVAAQKEVRA